MLKGILTGTSNSGRLLLLAQLQLKRTLIEYKASPKFMGFTSLKQIEREEEDVLFPILAQLGVVTSERNHSFSVPCHRVVKFIKLGAVNKQISVQYCHYLAQLVRETDDPADKDYYATYCGDLMTYLLKSDKNLPMLSRAALLCDIASTSQANCRNVCGILLVAEKLPPIDPRQFGRLFGSCLQFNMWPEARQLLKLGTNRMLGVRLCEPLVDGLIKAAEQLKAIPEDSSEHTQLRANVIETIYLFCEIAAQERIQFITRKKSALLQALGDLKISVKVNPNIKQSGRCTSCDVHLPLFDHRLVKDLNEAIKRQIFKGADKGLFVNTSPNDSSRFEKFLQKMFEHDKKPIDCVIDGLNIAYRSSIGYLHFKQQLTEDVSRTIKVPKTDSQAHTLINTIIRGNMLQQFKKILVVGKAHMQKWPGLMDFFRKNNIHFYSSYNNSKDDLFQLYASTLSPKSVLVTNDFLRDHLAQMDESNRTLMERWIDTRQVWIEQKSLRPILPTPFEKIPSVDRSLGIFHLPVIDYDQLELVGVVDPPPHLNSKALTWFCCQTQLERNKSSQTDK